jgi:hypothetical protein
MADVPAPTETNRGPRVKTNSKGLGSFIPPELKETGRRAVNLASAIDPIQGLMRGMSASGRAADTELSPEERKAALIEAGIETAAPLAMMGLGALAKQPVKATVLDILTPTGAPQAVVDDVSDPSRRAFMKGAVATGGIAAIAPDVITEALEKVPAAVKKLKPVPNPIDIFTQNMKILRREMEEAYDAADDMPVGMQREAYDEAIQNAEKLAYDLDATTEMDLRELISDIGPSQIAEAADESLEEISQALTDFRMVSEDEYIEQMIPLAEEIQRRGLLEVKDNGIFQYPYARTVVEDVEDYRVGENRASNNSAVIDRPRDLQMTEGDKYVTSNQQPLKQEQLRNIIIRGKDDGDSVDVINKKVVDAATRLKVSNPPRAFDDPNVEYVDTSEISRLIPRGNQIKYNVSTFQREGGGYYDPMSSDFEEFEKSGQETLRESIHNEGIKEPIAIAVSKETGEVLLYEGHHRLHAALQMGIPEIPVVVKVMTSALRPSEFQTPAIINTKGLKAGKNMRFSDLNYENRVKRPKASSNEGQDEFGARTSNYYYTNEPYRSDKPRTDERNFPPMRPGFFRITDEKADGGEMRKGVGSLSEIARRMNEGGPSSIDDEINAIVPSVIMAESSNDPKAVSEDGAIGLMQVLPSTAMKPGYGLPTIFELAREQGFVVDEETPETATQLLFMPDLNVEFGSRYLKAMRNEYDTMEDALRAYNAGPGNFNDYLAKGRDLSALDDEAVQYPLRVAAAGQGINPNEPAQYEAFTDSPEAFSTFMNMASEERPPAPRPRARPSVTYDGPRPLPRPTMPQDTPQQQMIQQAVASAPQPQSLQQKYSPQGIEQMLTGTNSELLLPRQFQQGSPYPSMR